MKKVAVLPMMLLLLVGHVHANNSAVENLFKIMSMDEQLKSGFEAMMPMVDQMAVQFKLNAAEKAELKNVFRNWFNEDLDLSMMMDKMKSLYTEAFTEKELKEIAEFYQTPVGKKFLEKSPELMKMGAQIGMREAKAKEQKLMERIRVFMDAKGIGQSGE